MWANYCLLKKGWMAARWSCTGTYMLESVDPNASRSRYGRAGWTPEFCVVGGKRERSISFEHVAAISCKFAKLIKSTKLSSHVSSSSSHTSTFQLLDKPWSQVSSLLTPGSCLQFLSSIGFSNPAARRFFIECLSVYRGKCTGARHGGG